MKASWKKDWQVFSLPTQKLSKLNNVTDGDCVQNTPFGPTDNSFNLHKYSTDEIIINGFKISIWVQRSDQNPRFSRVSVIFFISIFNFLLVLQQRFKSEKRHQNSYQVLETCKPFLFSFHSNIIIVHISWSTCSFSFHWMCGIKPIIISTNSFFVHACNKKVAGSPFCQLVSNVIIFFKLSFF